MFDPIAYINKPRWQESRLGLGRMRELMARLGNPQENLKFIHVAGTNGKGSTCAFIASILQAAGYKTGLFSSPFIEKFEERIRIDGNNISFSDLTAVTLEVREQAESMDDHPTEFELMCAVALLYFFQQACDVVVLEVGLGGRLDATNIIETPLASVITRIGLDHTAILGNTLAEIAQEKAGILKAGVPLVSYPQEKEAAKVIERIACDMNCSLYTPDFSKLDILPLDLSAGAQRTFSYKNFKNLQTTLLGIYQPKNAAVALEVIKQLRNMGFSISNNALRKGIEKAYLPGRFEIIDTHPLFIVDGGHNGQGSAVLTQSLKELFGKNLLGKQCAVKLGENSAEKLDKKSPEKSDKKSAENCAEKLAGEQYQKATSADEPRIIFLMSVLKDKDYSGMIEQVLPLAHVFVCFSPDNARALPAQELADEIRHISGQEINDSCTQTPNPTTKQRKSHTNAQGNSLSIYVAQNAQEALACARKLARTQDILVAFGSLYSVAALKSAHSDCVNC